MDISEIEKFRRKKKAVAEKILNKSKRWKCNWFWFWKYVICYSYKNRRVSNKNNLNITAIPTSKVVEDVCKEYKIKIGNLIENKIDWAFDGADEVDEKKYVAN